MTQFNLIGLLVKLFDIRRNNECNVGGACIVSGVEFGRNEWPKRWPVSYRVRGVTHEITRSSKLRIRESSHR